MLQLKSHHFGFRSIRSKIIVLFMLMSGAVLIPATSVIALHEWRAYRSSLVHETAILTDVIASNCTAALAFRDRQEATGILSALAVDRSVTIARLSGLEGALFASYEREGPRPELKSLPADGKSHEFSRRYLHTSTPVKIKGEQLGTLYLVTDLDRYYSTVKRDATLVVLVLLVSGSLTYLMAHRLQRIIAGPILALVRLASKVSQDQDYSLRADHRSQDELGELVDGFNHMLSQVEQRDAALRQMYEELELRVAERTHELKEAKDAAEEAVRVKSEFLANISHELRTPMHAILSFADLGAKKIASGRVEKVPGYLENIRSSGGRLLGLLNELLDLSKLEAGKMKFSPTPQDLSAVVGSAIDEVRSLVAERSISVQLHCVAGIVAEIDRSRVLQLIHNILGNAIKFSPTGGRVWVALDVENEFALLSIRDEGPGIPEQDLDLIFEKFMQSSLTKTGAGGTGLGLAICQEIVAAHRGSIWAENAPQGGAIICVRLPRVTSNRPDGGGTARVPVVSQVSGDTKRWAPADPVGSSNE